MRAESATENLGGLATLNRATLGAASLAHSGLLAGLAPSLRPKKWTGIKNLPVIDRDGDAFTGI
jgi:hypothetical protein